MLRRAGWARYAAPAALLLLASLALAVLRSGEVPGGSSTPAAPAAARRETRPTLDPARFVAKAAAAHQVAREIPAVLDELYCYCRCDKQFGHKSLLSCFTDGHAAT